MKYENIVKGKFILRENRFVAQVDIGGSVEKTHVKNTGRCRELLIPGADVYLEDYDGRMNARKYRYSLITVSKAGNLINMDSQAPNKAAGEALAAGIVRLPGMGELTEIRPETVYGDSRFDFYLSDKDGRQGFLEIKGVTLEDDGIARFPDAPTERGIKHLNGLCTAAAEGFSAGVLFVIQMKGVREFRPNDETHAAFGEALRHAAGAGVSVLAFDCRVTPDTMTIEDPVSVNL